MRLAMTSRSFCWCRHVSPSISPQVLSARTNMCLHSHAQNALVHVCMLGPSKLPWSVADIFTINQNIDTLYNLEGGLSRLSTIQDVYAFLEGFLKATYRCMCASVCAFLCAFVLDRVRAFVHVRTAGMRLLQVICTYYVVRVWMYIRKIHVLQSLQYDH